PRRARCRSSWRKGSAGWRPCRAALRSAFQWVMERWIQSGGQLDGWGAAECGRTPGLRFSPHAEAPGISRWRIPGAWLYMLPLVGGCRGSGVDGLLAAGGAPVLVVL